MPVEVVNCVVLVGVYTAVMVSDPEARADVAHVATPELLRVTEVHPGMTVPLALKAIVPVAG